MTSNEALESAIRLRKLAIEVDEVSLLLDSSKRLHCEHCGAEYWNNMPQKMLKERVTGASQRLRDIADVLERRHLDPEFLTGVRP
jgi:hypothetical protein